ncbi:MAG: DUF4293 domain-containing protein [Bacteroidota bacterium]
MIQRLQSLLLLVAALANFAALLLPYGYADTQDAMDSPSARLYGGYAVISALNDDPAAGENFGEFAQTTLTVGDDALLTIHALLIGLNGIALIGMIFLYNNRPRQMRLVYVGLLMLMAQIALAAAMIWTSMPKWVGAENVDPSNFDLGPMSGFFVPLVSVLLVWFAAKRIEKDERMVRDMDRLR